MKKVLGTMAGFIFGAFGIGVLGLLMSLTYQALQKLFPNSFENQIWGLIVYDIAAICWMLAFVFKSKSIMQYAASGFGFIVALIGTLAMVASEVMLGGQNLVPTQTQQIGQWMVYGFIGVTILHVIMLYAHHGAAPEIWEQIDIGIARSHVTDTAMKQATNRIEKETSMLADSLADEIVNRVKRDLNIPILANDTIFDPKAYEQATDRPAIKVPENVYRELENKYPAVPGIFTPSTGAKDEPSDPYTTIRTKIQDGIARIQILKDDIAETLAKDEQTPAQPPFPGQTPSE